MVQSPRLNGNILLSENIDSKTPKHSSLTSDTDTAHVSPHNNFVLFLALTIGSIGIIFGDIGTSPLYVLSTIFAENLNPTREQCTGVISLIIWNLIIVVSVKYAIFILMADNQGEGGTFALCGLLTDEHSKLGARAKHIISIISILAASLLIGDGALTPAISVLSAVEGITTASTSLNKFILPITVVIIIALYFVQMYGTSKIGLTFAPVMIVWFFVLFLIGVWRITFDPSILYAFNPWEGISYLIREKQKGFYQIGGIFLSVTGLEALYADLGHFGRWPVRTSWFFLVFPSVVANYLGQGAMIIQNPETISNPFYNAAPSWARWPMIVLATMATIIASQAIVTGVFSLISQAASLGYSPPLRVIHTSKKVIGQIYVPAINWIMMLVTISITLYFRSSTHLAHAYGVTVCSVMLITTILFLCVIHYVWRRHWIFIILFGMFLIIDLYFFAANAIKFFEGAWVALLIAIFFFAIGLCWYYGQRLLQEYLHIHSQTTALNLLVERFSKTDESKEITNTEESTNLLKSSTTENCSENIEKQIECKTDTKIDMSPRDDDKNESSVRRRISLIKHIDEMVFQENSSENIICTVTPGLGVFLTTSSKHTPHVFERVLARIHALPQAVIFLQMEYARMPYVDENRRLTVEKYGSAERCIYHITASYGYSEHKVQLLNILQLASTKFNVPIPEHNNITFYIPAISIQIKRKGWRVLFSKWALIVYTVLKHMFPFGEKSLALPPDHTVSVGMVVPL